MPEYTDATWQASEDRIKRGRVLADGYSQSNVAPYPLDGYRRHELKGNGLPEGWRYSLFKGTIYRELNGWLCVVRASRDTEYGPYVIAARDDGNRRWFDLQGQRTLEDAIARADEIMTNLDEPA